MKPKKECGHKSCRTLINYDETYCEEHKGIVNKVYDESREDYIVKFYNSAAWKKLRYQAMLRDGWLCQSCLEEGIYTQAMIGDHAVPVRIDWSKRLDIDNISCLCSACHNLKTAKEKEKYNL